ncbi:hypothetical protein BSM4216_0936 [Bacillus smithii]|nr:hypothetical protein BSM4216_0936 [Bacillus smithii]
MTLLLSHLHELFKLIRFTFCALHILFFGKGVKAAIQDEIGMDVNGWLRHFLILFSSNLLCSHKLL